MTATTERMLPLYEAKMMHQFDHRWATYDGSSVRAVTETEKANPAFAPVPRYWVSQADVDAKHASRAMTQWMLGWRDVARSTDSRTTIASGMPLVGAGDKVLVAIPGDAPEFMYANLNSFAFDFVARQKNGGTAMKYFIMKQLPILSPKVANGPLPWSDAVTIVDWVRSRVAELSYTSWDMKEIDLFEDSPPFVWNAVRRHSLISELDALFFHLYGIVRDDVDYIMDTFLIIKRKDEAAFGEFKTKRLILEAYEAMQDAIDTGTPFEYTLNPPPGQGPRHPAKETVS